MLLKNTFVIFPLNKNPYQDLFKFTVGKTNVLIDKTYQYLQFSGKNRVLKRLKFFG
jgi:hypothetical protein